MFSIYWVSQYIFICRLKSFRMFSAVCRVHLRIVVKQTDEALTSSLVYPSISLFCPSIQSLSKHSVCFAQTFSVFLPKHSVCFAQTFSLFCPRCIRFAQTLSVLPMLSFCFAQAFSLFCPILRHQMVFYPCKWSVWSSSLGCFCVFLKAWIARYLLLWVWNFIILSLFFSSLSAFSFLDNTQI